MKRIHTTCIIASIATALVVVGAFGGAYAGRGKRTPPGVLKGAKHFSASAVYSGSLDGQIHIGGKKVLVGKDTQLRSTEKGTVSKGYHVVRKPVYVAGVVGRDGVLRATMVVVNDAQPSSGGKAGVLPKDAPQ